MKDKKDYMGIDIDKMTIKEAIAHDIAMSGVIVDPAPMLPITPVVMANKAFKGAKSAFGAIKKAVGKGQR